MLHDTFSQHYPADDNSHSLDPVKGHSRDPSPDPNHIAALIKKDLNDDGNDSISGIILSVGLKSSSINTSGLLKSKARRDRRLIQDPEAVPSPSVSISVPAPNSLQPPTQLKVMERRMKKMLKVGFAAELGQL